MTLTPSGARRVAAASSVAFDDPARRLPDTVNTCTSGLATPDDTREQARGGHLCGYDFGGLMTITPLPPLVSRQSPE